MQLKNYNFQALNAQKFREQQEEERRRRVEELRARDGAKQNAVMERRQAIENAERTRREAILKKSQVRILEINFKKCSKIHLPSILYY